MIANPSRGQYALELDRPRVFCITMQAAREFRRLTGRGINGAFKELYQQYADQDDIDEELLITLLYVGLQHEDETLTRERVANMLTLTDGERLFTAVLLANIEQAGQLGNVQRGLAVLQAMMEAGEISTGTPTGPDSSPSAAAPSDSDPTNSGA